MLRIIQQISHLLPILKDSNFFFKKKCVLNWEILAQTCYNLEMKKNQIQHVEHRTFSSGKWTQNKLRTAQSPCVGRQNSGRQLRGITKKDFENFFVSQHCSGEKFTRRPFWFFWKFLVFLKVSGAAHLSGAKIFEHHWEGITKNSCHRKNSWGPFGVVLERLRYRKILCVRGYHFCRIFFCPTVPKKFVEEPNPLAFLKISGIEKLNT